MNTFIRIVLVVLGVLGAGSARAQQTTGTCGGVTVPAWVTASRPSSPNDQTVGYNQTTGYCETYQHSSSTWTPAAGSAGAACTTDCSFAGTTSVSGITASGTAAVAGGLSVGGATSVGGITASGAAALNGGLTAGGTTSVAVLDASGISLVNAVTAHNEIVGSDGVTTAGSTAFNSPSATFLSTDVGKTIILDGAGASGADLITTIATYVDAHDVTLTAATDSTFGATPWWTIGRAFFVPTSAVTTSYKVGDTIIPTGGTYSTQGVFTIQSLAAASPSVVNAGTGGTNGTACTFLGTTGVTRSWYPNGGTPTTGSNSYFSFTASVVGGALQTPTIVKPADYLTPPMAAYAANLNQTATFTNASASIGWASNTLSAGQPIQFANSGGALPTNFSAATTYYVSATGLTTSAFEVATTATGTPIVAGSAGTGTQTVSAVEPILKLSGTCTVPTNAAVGVLMGPSYMIATTAGRYTALPTNTTTTPVTSGGSGAGATLLLWGAFPQGQDTNITTPGDKIGGRWAYGTDDTAAINAAIATAVTNGGGEIYVPAGRSLMLGAFSIPWTGSVQPSQPPMRLTGAGRIQVQTNNGGYVTMYSAPLAGTVIDNHYSGGDGLGHTAKLDTRGLGRLEWDNMTIEDYGTDNYLFFQDSNTDVSLHDLTFLGNSSCFRMTCLEAGLRFSFVNGTPGTLSTSQPNAYYQGYNSHVRDIDFGHIQEAYEFGYYANNILIDGGDVDSTSGTWTNTTGAYHFYGGASNNVISGGNIESTGYPIPIVFIGTLSQPINSQNVFAGGPQISDSNLDGNQTYANNGLPTYAGFYFDSNASRNVVASVAVDNGLAGNFVIQTASPPINNLFLTYPSNPTVLTSGLQIWGGGIAVGTSTPPEPNTFGGGTGMQELALNGGKTNSGDGDILFFLNGGGICGQMGTASAITGTAINEALLINNNCASVELSQYGVVSFTVTSALNTTAAPLVTGATKFTSTGCSLTSPVGYGASGQAIAGVNGACVFTITINGATGMSAQHGWFCQAQDLTTPADTFVQTASSNLTATMTGTSANGDTLIFSCQPY